MHARIEIAEVVSFRLKLPRATLERLPTDLAAELPLALARDREEWLLEQRDGDCALRFRPVGEEVVLTEIAVCNDEGGVFFQRVLGPLLVRHEGDCELRLVWNAPERNTHGDFAAVTVRAGQTNYPGLSRPAQALRNALASAEGTAGGAAGAQQLSTGGPSEALPEDPAVRALLLEVDALLERGRQQFAEYQRLKAAGNVA